jgi:hypothetical protein
MITLKAWVGGRSLGWHIFGAIGYWLFWISLATLGLVLVGVLILHNTIGSPMLFRS